MAGKHVMSKVGYHIVKYCRKCRTRFLIEKGQFKTIYCTRCEAALKNSEGRK